MSIQTELTRIINAKAAIKTAIEGKGVTVPEATLLDGMASLIEAIEAGGGEKTLFGAYFETGSIIPASDITTQYTIRFQRNFSIRYRRSLTQELQIRRALCALRRIIILQVSCTADTADDL